MDKHHHIGLDAGSVSVKVVLFDSNGSLLKSSYRRHKGQPLIIAMELLRDALRECGESSAFLSITGSSGRLIGTVLGTDPVNEVVAHAAATQKLYPSTGTIIELGGEDSKLIILNTEASCVRDFSMNSVCAAGTGSFLDQQAERLQLTIEEFSTLSLRSKNPPRIAGRCSVFAKSDMIHLQQIATPVEDIVAGLCFAVARNFRGSIARGREMPGPVSFQGGVAANQGMARAFREVLERSDLFVPEEHAYMGAIGAVLKDIGNGTFFRCSLQDIQKLSAAIEGLQTTDKRHLPLIQPSDDFLGRHGVRAQGPESGHSSPPLPQARRTMSGAPVRAYLGVDIGSISTNLAVIDDNCRLLAKRYLMTAGRPIEAVKTGLSEIGAELGLTVEIAGVGTTGSGRYMIADFIGADIVKNEITAQATAAAFIDRDVDTIFEIGGQDSKYISLRDGVIVDFEMNKACAAGTGSFLEEQAEKLSISVRGEFQESAFRSANPCRLGERCTVFMENSLMANLQRGVVTGDLLAGLSYSIVQNYINRVVCKRPIGKKIFFQGGVAFNKSVVAAFEKYLGRQVIVPPHHDVTGAIGMALLAKEHRELQAAETGHQKQTGSLFKGFAASGRPYEISSFECGGCPNVCEINRIRVEGETGNLFYGGRCEKYDVRKDRTPSNLPDLFRFREERLWETHKKRLSAQLPEIKGRGTIGIPFVFYFQDYLPFWTTLLWELGFHVEVSPPTDRHIVDRGLETVLAETCFPVKTAHGHIKHLIDSGVDAIFLPSFVDLNSNGNTYKRGLACPYTQTTPYSAKIAFRQTRFLSPVITLSRGTAFLSKELANTFREYGVKPGDIRRALNAAQRAQTAFLHSIQEEGRRTLSEIKDKAVVIVGRAYNSFDRGMNLNLPKKLADLGMLSIPMDFLPIDREDITADWPDMYWRAGQRILSAARIIRKNPLLYPVYIGSFSCGPDSFIIKFFEEELSGKPYLHLEIDAHSADAGAITRCEAFIDSIGTTKNGNGHHADRIICKRNGTGKNILDKRTIYLPRMSDHVFAVAAAFEHCGISAEVLPESTGESTDLGRKHVSGKECYPCAVTTGDMVMKIAEPGFDPDRSAFFMPSGSGPCRFGQYNIFHRMVLRDLGLDNTPVLSPVQNEDFYKHLGNIGRAFTMRTWEGVIAVELLTKCLHETRPYEREKGSSDALYSAFLEKVYRTLAGRANGIDAVLGEALHAFKGLPVDKEVRPLIGIVGEIFVRSNKFSNEALVRTIEALGGEAYLAPVEEWLYYVNYTGRTSALSNRNWLTAAGLSFRRYFQKRTEERLAGQFTGFLKTLHEPDTADLIRLAAPYVHHSFEGETILSIGKSIDLSQRGASGIVSAMPFGCMPGTIVSGLMRGLSNDLDIPCLSIPYDGTESPTTRIQLEAFMDQARGRLLRTAAR